jgi:hypothetical protein
MKSIIECVMSVPDPRRGNHKKHELRDMLFASLMSVLCGYDSYMLRSVQICKRANGQHPAVGTSTSITTHQRWSRKLVLRTCTFAHLHTRKKAPQGRQCLR